jgi:hypothetical protein
MELSYGASVDVEGAGVSAFKTEIVNATTTISGDLDWVHYGYQVVTDVNRKATGNGQIKKDNIGQILHYPPPIAPYVKSFNWSGGTPIASKDTRNGIRADKVNDGFNVRMPAGTVARKATLYVSTVNAQGRLTVDIPGGNVEPAVLLVDSKGSTNGYRSFVFEIYFRAKSNKELSLKWIKTEDYNGGQGTIVLHGAGMNTFEDVPATLIIYNAITPGYRDIAISGKPHYVDFAIDRRQPEGIRNMKLFRDGALIATVNGFTAFPEMTMTSPRKAQYDIYVTDNLGTKVWSNSKTYYLWSEYTHSGGMEIPDNLSAGASFLFTHSQTYVGDVRLKMNVTHPYVGDLKVSLISPSGGVWTVLDRLGGAGHNVVNLESSEGFSDDITLAPAPFTGRFKPMAVNPPILSQPGAGWWRLQVSDMAKYDVGTTGPFQIFIRDL